jgi:hypothetical protein
MTWLTWRFLLSLSLSSASLPISQYDSYGKERERK